MTNTKARFTHPALEAMETEKRALHGVLKAIAPLPTDEDRRAVLARAIASMPAVDAAASAP
jgi:hypothetical protein